LRAPVRNIRWPELRWYYALPESSKRTTRYAAHRGFSSTEREVDLYASRSVLEALRADPLWVTGGATFAEATPFPHVRLVVKDPSRITGHRYENWYPAWVAGVLRLGVISPRAFREAVMRTTPAFREDVSRVWTLSASADAVFALLQAHLPSHAWDDGTPFAGNAPL